MITEIVAGTHVVLLECLTDVQDALCDRLRSHYPLSVTAVADRSDLGKVLAATDRPVTIIVELSDPLDERLDLARWLEEGRDDQTMILLVVPDKGRGNDDGGDGDPADGLPTEPRRRLVTAKSWRWPGLSRLLGPSLAST